MGARIFAAAKILANICAQNRAHAHGFAHKTAIFAPANFVRFPARKFAKNREKFNGFCDFSSRKNRPIFLARNHKNSQLRIFVVKFRAKREIFRKLRKNVRTL